MKFLADANTSGTFDFRPPLKSRIAVDPADANNSQLPDDSEGCKVKARPPLLERDAYLRGVMSAIIIRYMPERLFEYDVFLSFSSDDEELVRPIWQQLTLSGLLVFWSDSALRDRVGVSWFDVIQDSLSRSRHLILVCTPASLASKWVKREYVAFFNHHYAAPDRLLVPLLSSGSRVSDLPLFLRELEAVTLERPDSIKRLVRALGGVDVEGLKAELAKRDEELRSLRLEYESLSLRLAEATKQTRTARPPIDNSQHESLDGLQPPSGIPQKPRLAVHSRGAAESQERTEPAPSGAKQDPVVRFVNYWANETNLPPGVVAFLVLVLFFIVSGYILFKVG